jgi:ABC-type uncharacterized transport system, periplasmic component
MAGLGLDAYARDFGNAKSGKPEQSEDELTLRGAMLRQSGGPIPMYPGERPNPHQAFAFERMKRRSICIAIATVAATGPSGAQVQPRGQLRRVAYLGNLSPTSAAGTRSFVDAFFAEMRRYGWVEGKNLAYELRFANGDPQLLQRFARELVAAKVDVIAAVNTVAAMAAKKATSEIPIVFVAASPVEYGLITSLRHPGGNVTGVSLALDELVGKRMQLLAQAVKGVRRIAYLGVDEKRTVEHVRAAAKALGLDVLAIDALPNGVSLELPSAIAQGGEADAWLVDDYPQFYPQRAKIFALIAAQRKPAMYSVPYWVKEGAFLAYAQDTVAAFSSAAGYVDRILRGAKPSELPVEEPTRFVFAVNLTTARALGINIPNGVLLQANEVSQ